MRITTERLELREYAADDLPALLAYQADPRTRDFYGPDEGLPAQMPELLRTFLGWAAEEPRRNWQLAIVLREDARRVVGSCGLRSTGTEPRCGDLGIDLSPELWGRGYGTEAASAMLDFGFGSLGFTHVHGQIVSVNARVEALVGRLGFRFVGSYPGTAWMRERGWTYAEWELAADDWRGRPGAARRTGAEIHLDDGGPRAP